MAGFSSADAAIASRKAVSIDIQPEMFRIIQNPGPVTSTVQQRRFL